MKNGILSMQRIYNYGSWLQAYALKQLIEEINPHSVQFVDYRVEKPVTAYGAGYLKYVVKNKKNQVGDFLTSKEFVVRFLKNSELTHIYRFQKKYLKQLLGSTKFNYSPQLDNLIIGSDEVFNCTQSNPRVGYSRELFGYNNHADHLMSYAASVGNTTIEKIRHWKKDKELAELLNKFDEISVRDRNSSNVIKELTGREAEIHLDPVLIYDFAKEKRNSEAKKISDKYLVVYTYPGRLTESEAQSIKKYADKHDLRIVGINAYYKFIDKFVHDHPLNIIQWFNNAECVVTDTFHGTIISVINHKRFATIIRKSENGSYGNYEKLNDLLDRINLKNRIVDDAADISRLLDLEVDYSDTDEIIREERIHTNNYLRKILK